MKTNSHLILRISGICIFLGCLFINNLFITPQNFRFFSDIIQNTLAFVIILFILWPDSGHLQIAFGVGLFTMGYDFFIETLAVKLDWWYPLGGTQAPPILVIPIEMVISFLIFGAITALFFQIPERVRTTDSRIVSKFKKLFKNSNMDVGWQILLILVISIAGTYGDYSAGPTVWVPGPSWHPFFTFLIWFHGGLLTILIFFLLKRRAKKRQNLHKVIF
ncbi:MAG: hypothetical protein HWN65_20635 [Candidatus Helarchaeota archaeon]|nr:hypothetical protein [Candidatus Helarchaeota archaeon]